MPLPQDCETGPPEEATAAGERAFSACDSEPAIDLAHLDRMTFGEKSLAREVLRLFDRQADILSARISQADPEAAAALAHTLKGSARGVGRGKSPARQKSSKLPHDSWMQTNSPGTLKRSRVLSPKRGPPLPQCSAQQNADRPAAIRKSMREFRPARSAACAMMSLSGAVASEPL
jgi:hypothetical protein